MTYTKLAFMAIPVLAVLMIGAAMTPAYSAPTIIQEFRTRKSYLMTKSSVNEFIDKE